MSPTLLNEEVAAQLWLKGFLEADGTLMGMLNGGVYLRTTPTTAGLPLVKIDIQDREDLMVVEMHRIWSNITYLVRGVTRGPDWTEVQAIANRIDQLLHRANGSSTDVNVQQVYREETFTDETVEGGDLYHHAGGIYRLLVQAI